MKSKEKVYIHYAYEDEGSDKEAPINEVWSDGQKPKKKMLKEFGVIKIYDIGEDGVALINGRIWNGVE